MILSSQRSSYSIKTSYFSDETTFPISRRNSISNNDSKLPCKSTHSLSNMISTINKRKFLLQNKKALKAYDKILKQIRHKNKIILSCPNKNISNKNSKYLLSSFDFDSIDANEKYLEKLKQLNRIKLNQYNSKIIGVDEGLIELPYNREEDKSYNLTKVNNKPKSRIKISHSSNNNHNNIQYKKTFSAFSSPRSSFKNILIGNINNTTHYLSTRNFPKVKKKLSSDFSIIKTKVASQTIDNQIMKQEILKLNQWDNKNAINNQKANDNSFLRKDIYFDTLNLSSLKWINDIKSDPKQLEKLSRNKYFKDFFNKLEQEEKIFSPRKEVWNKKDFNFNVFTQNSSLHKKASSNGDELLSKLSVYGEILKEKIKNEEKLKNDFSKIAQQLYELKSIKKLLTKELIDNSNEISALCKQLEETKKEDKLKRKSLENEYIEEYQTIVRQSDHNCQRKNTSRSDKNAKKDLLFIQTNRILGSQSQLNLELQEKITSINEKKIQINDKIEHLSEKLNSINDKMKSLKIKLTQKLKVLTNYYLDILSKGTDVRESGISWVIIQLISLNVFFTYENFPVFLTHEQIDYIIKVAYIEYELSEWKILFRILKKKQYDLKNEQLNKQKLLIKKQEENKQKEKDDCTNIKKLIKKIEGVANKYENVVKICLNEKKDDENLNLICKGLHNKMISFKNDLNSEEQQSKESSKKIDLFFQTGSYVKLFNENKQYKAYFDDIFYLNNEIIKKEKELITMKERQLKIFKKQIKNSKNKSQNDLIFAALFGNGISL